MKRPLLIAALAAALALALTAGSASAASSFSNSTRITIGKASQTSPYPSSIDVDGLSGRVADVVVTLHRFSHTWPDLVDVLLVSPDGRSSIVMSGACGTGDVVRATWVFSNQGPTPMPGGGPCSEFVYRPTDYPENFADSFGPSAPPGPYTANLGNFIGSQPNGTWRLYVVAPAISDTGEIELGWSLAIETATPDAMVPTGDTGSGVADSYPLKRTVSGVDGVITDLNVALIGVYHARPEDLELMLEGPGGQKVALMSDVCGGGSTAVSQGWGWDDEAISTMPVAGPCPDGWYRPGWNDEPFPYPASSPLDLHNPLSVFDLTDPNGVWRLWAYDDRDGAPGMFMQPFRLDIQTRPKAKVAFTEGAVDLAEGGARELTLTRSASTALGAAVVQVTSTPLTATSESDFRPVSREIHFAAGETQKTISVEALADSLHEDAETFSLNIGYPKGDAELGAPGTAMVTILDNTPTPTPTPTPTGTDTGTDTGAGGPGTVGGGAVVDRDPPVIGGLRVVRRRIRYTLSEPAAVTLQLQRARHGRYVTVRSLRRAGRAGRNAVAVRIRAGAYRVRVRARDAAGNRSARRTRRFRVR